MVMIQLLRDFFPQIKVQMRSYPKVNNMGFYLTVNVNERGRQRVREQKIVTNPQILWHPVASFFILVILVVGTPELFSWGIIL